MNSFSIAQSSRAERGLPISNHELGGLGVTIDGFIASKLLEFRIGTLGEDSLFVFDMDEE